MPSPKASTGMHRCRIACCVALFPCVQVIELLVSMGLLTPGEEGESDAGPAASFPPAAGVALTFADIMAKGNCAVSITRAGYEFLLRDTAVQLWTFLRAYIESAGTRGTRPIDVLAFLLELGFCTAGSGYAVSALSPSQRALLTDFESFGLVYIPVEQAPLSPSHAEVDLLATAQAAGANLSKCTG